MPKQIRRPESRGAFPMPRLRRNSIVILGTPGTPEPWPNGSRPATPLCA